MANKITDTKYYASIADAIRAKNGSSATYYPADMAQAIEDIPTGSDTIDAVILSKTATEYINNTFDGTVVGGLFQNSPQLKVVKMPHVKELGQQVFKNCSALEEIDFTDLTKALNNSFQYAFAANTEVSFPSLKNTGAGLFSNTKFKSISIPSIVDLSNSCFKGNTYLKSITIPNTLNSTSLWQEVFSGCTAIESIVFEGHLSNIYTKTFYNCTSCLIYDFSHCTSVPSLANTDAFTNINANAVIKVPSALESTWKTATNWSTYASYIQGV